MVMPIPQNKLKEENVEIEESFKEVQPVRHIQLSEEEIKVNRKITDYFKIQKKEKEKERQRNIFEQDAQSPPPEAYNEVVPSLSKELNRSPPSPTRSKSAGD